MRVIPAIILLTLALPAVAGSKKPSGDVADPQSFAAIQSYCVATRDLPDGQRDEVEGFLKDMSAPKQLLTKLPWKTVADCREGKPDAVVHVEFVELRSLGGNLGDRTIAQVRGTDTAEPPYRVKAVLGIRDSASDRLLYKVQATPLDNSSADSPMMADSIPGMVRRSALHNVFWALVQDVQMLRTSHTK